MLRKSFPISVMVVSALLMSAPAALKAQYAINLVAGGGPNALPVLSSSIGFPGGIARDGLGNTYIADVNSSRIFKVDSTGMLTVFAGNGSGIGGEGGYSGDGGPATSAELGRPESVAVDAAGDVFIADTDNSVIRKVAARERNDHNRCRKLLPVHPSVQLLRRWRASDQRTALSARRGLRRQLR